MQRTQERPVAATPTSTAPFPTILVHAEPGVAATRRVEAAASFARDTDARLIGLGAETFEPVQAFDPMLGAATGDLLALIQEQVSKNLKNAEAAFRRDAAGADLEWRVVQDFPARALAKAARLADLIVLGPRTSAPSTSHADPADVVMRAGRPVLLVPDGRSRVRTSSILVAWKDTRECRRAIADAMPLLRRAEAVVVAGVAARDQAAGVEFEIDDVLANLKRNGVKARAVVTTAPDETVANELDRIARGNEADLIVTGAYGQSRLREWAFGGVTDDFLHRPNAFVLMSH